MEIANELTRFKREISAFDEARARAEENQKKMFQEIMELNAMWEGPAHSTFEASFQKDHMVMEEVFRFLKRFKEELDIAHTEYQKCENSVASTVAAIKV